EGSLVRPQRAGRLAALASLAAACPGQRSRTATALRPQPAQICPGHSRQCLLPHAYQRPGGCEQPHQGDQAHGLWLPGLSLLLPENQGRLPRESAMNQKKAPHDSAAAAKSLNHPAWLGLEALMALPTRRTTHA